jgi:sRNA-binding carbon storage regulator CsrA
MRIFSLATDEGIVVGDDVAVKVLRIEGDEVWLEIDRPDGFSMEQVEENWLGGELQAVR